MSLKNVYYQTSSDEIEARLNHINGYYYNELLMPSCTLL